MFVTVALSDMRKMEPEGHMVALETENKQLKVCTEAAICISQYDCHCHIQ